MLCQFAHHFPPLVADFLERGRQFKRRVREETITDLLMVHLQNLGSNEIIVDFPDEPTTGADMEWNVLIGQVLPFTEFSYKQSVHMVTTRHCHVIRISISLIELVANMENIRPQFYVHLHDNQISQPIRCTYFIIQSILVPSRVVLLVL